MGLPIDRMSCIPVRDDDMIGQIQTDQMAICCADIGSVQKGKFGWASIPAVHNADYASPRSLARFVAEMLEANLRVALGFECPLWVPIADEPLDLTRARRGEGSRAWSAHAGAASLATGVAEVCWLLDQIRRDAPPVEALLDWEAFERTTNALFVWEALVTADAKTGTHQGDAQAAVDAFKDALPDLRLKNAVIPTHRTRSLIGGAMLWSGWTQDLKTIAEPCIVIKA